MEEQQPSPSSPKPSRSIKSMIDQLPPLLAFWSGVIVTAAVIFAAGFIILLTLVAKGADFGKKTSSSTTTTTNTAKVNSNTNSSSKSSVTAQIDMNILSHIRGEGDITIVEFSDTECPFCKQFHSTMLAMLEKYKGKVRWAYKHFPLSIHSKAPREAEATECASEQGKFWEYTDLLFERTPSNNRLEDDELFTIATDVGLDRTKFDECLESGKYKIVVNTDATQAVEFGGQGTPFNLIVDSNGKVLTTIPGALPLEDESRTDVSEILDALLK